MAIKNRPTKVAVVPHEFSSEEKNAILEKFRAAFKDHMFVLRLAKNKKQSFFDDMRPTIHFECVGFEGMIECPSPDEGLHTYFVLVEHVKTKHQKHFEVPNTGDSSYAQIVSHILTATKGQ